MKISTGRLMAAMKRKLPRSKVALAALLTSTLCGLGACSGDERTPLVLYSPHGRDLLGLFEKEFEKIHPTIDVQWLDMGSQEVYDRVRTEAANPQGDVFFGGPATILARAANENLLEPYRPAWADATPTSTHDPQNRFFALYRTPPILVYNEEALTPEQAPRDWDDLLSPQFRNQVLIREPVASGTMRTIFGMILARSVRETGNTDAGFAWLRRLDGQTKEYVSNPALLHLKMERREGLVTCWELTDILFQRKRGAKLGYVFPASGTPVIEDSVGLIRGARHADAGRLFLDWVGSKEIQELAANQLFRLPARTDLPADQLPDWARDALKQMVVAEVDWALVGQQQTAWMQQWDREIRGRN